MDTSHSAIPFEDLHEHAGWARALARQLVSDSATAEDLAQDVLVKALRNPPREDSNLRGWFARVLRNAAIQRARHEGSRAGVEQAARGPAEVLAPDVLASEAEERERLARLVMALGEPYRSTVLMRFWHGLGPSEIARQLGIPAGTARWRLKVGLDQLRCELDRTSDGQRRNWLLALLPLASRDRTAAAAVAAPSAWLAAVAVLLAGGLIALGLTWSGALRSPGTVHGTGLQPSVPGEAVSAFERGAALAAAPEPEAAALRAPVAQPGAGARAQSGLAESATQTPTARVLARALDAAGLPIAGATLSQVSPPQAPSQPSGADGAMVLVVAYNPLRKDGELHFPERKFVVRAPGRVSRLATLSGRVTDAAIDLGHVQLEPGGELTGVLVDPQGRPLAQAWVEAVETQTEWEGLTAWSRRNLDPSMLPAPERVTFCDDQGRFLFSGLPPGRWKPGATAAGFWPSLGAICEVRLGERIDVGQRALDPITTAQQIAGRVLDAEGQPLARARIQVRWSSPDLQGVFDERSDAEGAFHITLPPGAARASLEVSGRRGAEPLAALTDVAAGSRGVELRLADPGRARLRVRVRDARGADLAGATIAVFGGLDGEPRELAFERSADGALVAPAPGGSLFFEASAAGHSTASFGPFESERLTSQLVFQLAPEVIVRGRALADGAPASAGRVSIFAAASGQTSVNGFASRVEPKRLLEAGLDASGAFEVAVPEQASLLDPRGRSRSSGLSGFGSVPESMLRSQAPRQVYVRIECPGFAPLERGPLDCDAGAVLELGELTLGAPGSIRGRVSSADGNAGGLRVAASRGDGLALQTALADDGTYRFDGLMPGPWEVRVVEPRQSRSSSTSGFGGAGFGREPEPPSIPANCTVEAGRETTFDLTHAPVFGLKGNLFIGRAPAAGARVWLATSDAQAWGPAPADALETDAMGGFELHGSQAGAVRVVFEAADFPRLIVPQRLERGLRGFVPGRLDSARLDVSGLGAATGGAPTRWLVWEDGERLGLQPLDGDVENLRVAAGHLRLVRWEPTAGVSPRHAETLATVELEAGKRGRLRVE